MKKTILIIEDESNVLTAMKDKLEHEGYEIVTAIDGASGILQAEKLNPDLIILDIMLPDISGHKICQAIKKIPAITSRILMVTSKLDEVDAAKAEQSGADEFTVKTIDFAPILEKINSLV